MRLIPIIHESFNVEADPGMFAALRIPMNNPA